MTLKQRVLKYPNGGYVLYFLISNKDEVFAYHLRRAINTNAGGWVLSLQSDLNINVISSEPIEGKDNMVVKSLNFIIDLLKDEGVFVFSSGICYNFDYIKYQRLEETPEQHGATGHTVTGNTFIGEKAFVMGDNNNNTINKNTPKQNYLLKMIKWIWNWRSRS